MVALRRNILGLAIAVTRGTAKSIDLAADIYTGRIKSLGLPTDLCTFWLNCLVYTGIE